MKLTVTTLSDQIFNIDVSEDMELENFKALCASETGFPSSQIVIVWNGRPLHDDKRKLKDYGIKDGEVLLIQHMQGVQGTGGSSPFSPDPGRTGMPSIDFSTIQIPGMGPGSAPTRGGAGGQQSTSQSYSGDNSIPEDPATLREMLLASPHDISLLKERNPALADALLSGSLDRFTEVLRKQQAERAERDRERIRMMTADPFDPDAQSKIAEEIRLRNVESNMETAMEFSPESFGQVAMLYIDCVVNGHPVKAFVDSGAQMTIMSQRCAERCNIKRLVDTRWAGVAKGVGTQKIIGRVHLGQIQIGQDFLQSSFSILEEQPMDMLLGLDMLKRHQCSIDLRRNVLVVGTTGKETPFLAEGDLPEHARLNNTASSTDQTTEDEQLARALATSANEASGPSGAGTSTDSTVSQYPETSVKILTDYGFSRSQAISELTKSRGNVDQALAALFAASLAPPK